MLKLSNLDKICKKFNFKVKPDEEHFMIYDSELNRLFSLGYKEPIELVFCPLFNWIDESLRWEIIKALAKDYEEHEKDEE